MPLNLKKEHIHHPQGVTHAEFSQHTHKEVPLYMRELTIVGVGCGGCIGRVGGCDISSRRGCGGVWGAS